MMKNKFLQVLAVALFTASLSAQSPVDGFMQGKGKGNVVVSYAMEKYDKVLLVPKEVDGVPVFNDVKVTSQSIYATYGLLSNLDVVVSLPYITAKGNASEAVLTNLNFQNERKGIQDVSLFLKFNPFNCKVGSSNLSFIGSIGYQAPVGNYRADEGLQSIIAIGNRAQTLSFIGIAMFKTKYGIFTTGQFGGMTSTNGVPDSYMSDIKLGYAANKIYADLFLSYKATLGGTDILGNGFTGFFPGTRVNATKVGLNLYAPVYKKIGLAGGVSSYIAGRNLGKGTIVYGAIVYKI
jgi:hypothetical protein